MARAARKPDRDLARYRAKRDFTRTPEPKGGAAGRDGTFVVQHHWARRDHFDFRLAINGVLKSWAVTRGPSADPRTKRLAVRVEDHPADYAGFEGTIAKGEYGGGTVQVWDRGSFTTTEADPAAAIDKGSLKVWLEGERMKGGWALVRMKPGGKEKRENWLLIKERDAFAEEGDDLATRYPDSVATGRTKDEIAAGGEVWANDRAAARAAPAPRGKRHAPLAFIAPMLCTAREKPPAGEEWLHETKYDGYRLEAVVQDGEVALYTREGLDWTPRFPAIARALRKLDVTDAILDGEAVVFDGRGVSDFGGLVEALKTGAGIIHYAVFDLLRLDGADLRELPLAQRKARLEKLVGGVDNAIVYASHLSGDGDAIFTRALAAGVEGIVSKRAQSPYRSGRGAAWVKVKGAHRDDVTIIGWLPSERGRVFRSLLTARERSGRLTYSGAVGTGFDARMQERLMGMMSGLARGAPPDVAGVKAAPKEARWLEPGLIAEVEMRGVTREGLLRQAAFIGVREDRTRETQAARGRAATGPASVAKTTKAAPPPAALPAGFRLTHPEKPLFPAAGVTKRDLAAYFAAVAPRILPHLARRPVSLVRAPDGVDGQRFFQRHVLPGMTKGIEPVKISGDKQPYISIASLEGLLTCAQFDVLELHGWGALATDIEHPDRVVFDLDPDEALPFAEIVRAAEDVRDLLAAADLESFALVSGGKGVHVVAPLAPKRPWAEIEAFCGGFARRLAEGDSRRFVAVMSKARRTGRIYIDFLRNKKSASAIVPWSPRARANASVAVPVTWERLRAIESASAITLAAALSEPADQWKGFFETRQTIRAKTLALFEAA